MSATTAAVPFWRAAGMTYIGYSNVCAALVRSCLKEPYKSEVASREKVHFSLSKWSDEKQEKPSKIPARSLPFYPIWFAWFLCFLEYVRFVLDGMDPRVR
jgi:F-type H+-transporting ATPase subunit epsilon